MIHVINTATTGLESFSKGLSIISENVANLNTTGFKQQRIGYFDLGEGQGAESAAGDGVETGQPYRQMNQGEIRQSDSSIDTAIRGAGFFVLKEGDTTLITRAGQFTVDEAGLLKLRDTDAVLQGLSAGQLSPLSIADHRTHPAQATTRVTFKGVVNSGGTPPLTVPDFTVYDDTGRAHIFKVSLSSGGSAVDNISPWVVNVTVDGVAAGSVGPLRYYAGSPVVDSRVFDSFTYTPTGGSPLTVILDFSKTSLSNNGALEAPEVDGYALGNLSELRFTDTGALKATYSNGQSREIGQLALANTFELEKLRAVGKNQFAIDNLNDLTFDNPGRQGLGTLASGSVEASNVELTSQFSELIITQRAYQASSQVITTTNEMLSVLFEIKGRR